MPPEVAAASIDPARTDPAADSAPGRPAVATDWPRPAPIRRAGLIDTVRSCGGRAREHGLVGARVISAEDRVTRHDDEVAPERPGLQLPCGGVAHQQMAPEGRNDQSIEGVIIGRSLASGKLQLNFINPVAHMPSSDHLIWIDLEMTGLRPESDSIIEIATVVTDKELTVIADGPVFAVHQPEGVLALMDDWNQKQHGSSGLIARVRASTTTEAEAEARTMEFLTPLVKAVRHRCAAIASARTGGSLPATCPSSSGSSTTAIST